jgi:hypothetical protein
MLKHSPLPDMLLSRSITGVENLVILMELSDTVVLVYERPEDCQTEFNAQIIIWHTSLSDI